MRDLLIPMAASDFKSRYAGTALGALWAFLQPLVTLLVYVFVFSVGFKSAPVSGVPYVLWLFCGMVPWLFFSEVWSGATSALFSYAPLVKKTRFPVELLPPVRAVSALFVHVIFFALLIATVLFCGEPLSVYALQSLYYSFCAFALSLGLGVLCAAVSPFFKDIVNTVAIILQVGFWVTPVAWSPAIFGEGIVGILKFNPVFYLVQGYRDSFLGGVWFWQRPAWGLYFWLFSAAVWAVAAFLFKRLRPQFADAL